MSRREAAGRMPARGFARCSVCTHAAMVRLGAPCLACGGAMVDAPAPANLFDGWRCGCYQCTWTPC